MKSRRRRFKQGTFVANNIARTLAEKLGGAEAVDLVEGDVVRFALASVPVGSGGHRVREVGALSRRERGVMKSERRFDRFLLVKGPVPAHQRWPVSHAGTLLVVWECGCNEMVTFRVFLTMLSLPKP